MCVRAIEQKKKQRTKSDTMQQAKNEKRRSTFFEHSKQ